MEKESERIKRKLLRIIGAGYLVLGIIVILASSRGITGFVIFEDIPSGVGYVLGIVFLIVGVLVLMAGGREPTFRGRDSLREHNKEAGYLAREAYREEHGRYPNKQELIRYIREHHERGTLHELVEERKHARKIISKV